MKISFHYKLKKNKIIKTKKNKIKKTKKIIKTKKIVKTKKNIKHFEFTIVGGGISGLYCYYKLLKERKIIPEKSILFEKSNTIGGRIKSVKIKKNNIEHIFEAGAGRFSSNHKLLIKLIKELNLYDKIYKISGDSKFISNNKDLKKYKSVYYYFKKVVKESKTKTDNYLRSKNYINYCIEVLGEDISNYLVKAYSYNDIFKTNAYDAIRLFKKSMNPEYNNYFILTGGYSQIIKKLKDLIIKMGGNIKLNCEINNIKYKNNMFTYYCKKKSVNKYKTKNIILALPKSGLEKINFLKPIKPMLNSIGQSPLMRIYAIFKKEDIWFENMGKMNTDNNLRFIIPINKKNGSIMISYGDEEYAEFWNKIIKKSKTKKEWKAIVMKYVRELFKINIKSPIWIQNYYWKNGVSYWKPYSNSKIISKKIIQPIEKNGSKISLFICGSNYSMTNAWVEGALETVEQILNII
tara:strand:+ start:157 stop:1545 length:1389 start_codon:yes stop_codon:yes gene_type:complete